MKDIIFVNSHPIQYFAPLYKFMNEKGIKVKAWYCTDDTIKGNLDKEFGVKVKWDIPLLEGYEYKFFKNNSWKPSHSNGFFGLVNLGMIKELFSIPKSVIVVHGWHYFTLLFILLLGKLKGHTVCLRCDMPFRHEEYKKGLKQIVKVIGLKYIVFPRVSKFLYIGSQNKLFYEKLGVGKTQLISCPYAVDNLRFKKEYDRLSPQRNILKNRLSIFADDKVIIFSAKYISKKRPLDLLKAYHMLNQPNIWLIFVGEGHGRREMERYIKEHNLEKVILTGFINQSNISEYYAIGDLFVMCSSLGENWGLSVNEAMNFNLPLVLSDLTGCSEDLVKEGANGYTFKTGDIEELSQRLKQVLIDNSLSMNPNSQQVLEEGYSFDVIVNNIRVLLD